MKSKKILIITVVVILLVVIGSFIAYYLATKNNTNDAEETKVHINTTEPELSPKFLNVNQKDITLFENSLYDFSDFISVFGERDWTIDYSYNGNLLEIQDNYILSVKEYSQSVTIVTFTIEPNFDYTKYDEFKNKTYPELYSFEVNILPRELNIGYNINCNDINDFDITFAESRINLKTANFCVINEDISIANITNTNGYITLKNVNLNNKLQTNLQCTYTLKDDNNQTITKSILVPINQNKNLINYSWQKALKDGYKLYLTKNNEYSTDYPNSASLVVNKNFDIINPQASLTLTSGAQEGIIISDLSIYASEVGEYTIKLSCSNIDIAEFNISVTDIVIYSVDFGEISREIDINTDLDLTINEDDINAQSELANYTINYEFVTNNIGATLIDGVFFSSQAGECVVRISVRDLYRDIAIIVVDNTTSECYLLDATNSVISSLSINVSELDEGEYYLSCHPSCTLDGQHDFDIVGTNDVLTYGEYTTGLLLLMFDVNKIQLNEEFIVQVSIYNLAHELEYTCEIAITFI